jgi:hypothetical protein
MLQTNKAFASFSVDDLQEAKRFYEQTLGVRLSNRKRAWSSILETQMFSFIPSRIISPRLLPCSTFWSRILIGP